METIQIKSMQDILAMKQTFESSGWNVGEYEPCLLLYKLDINKQTGAIFISKSIRIEPGKIVGYHGMQQVCEMKFTRFSLSEIKKSVCLVENIMEPSNDQILMEVDEVKIEEIKKEHTNVVEKQKSGLSQRQEINPYNCTFCPKRFISFYRLINHQKSEHFKEARSVIVTRSSTKVDSSVENDIKLEGKGGHLCNICRHIFSTNRSFESHMIRKHKGFQCEICSKTYKNNFFLKMHKKYAHDALTDREESYSNWKDGIKKENDATNMEKLTC